MVTSLPCINFLYTNIGRGHPFYLDGILEALIRKGNIKLVSKRSDVFEVSHGVSKAMWKAVRWTYVKGSSPGLVGVLYSKLRSKSSYNRPSIILNMMGRDIRRRFLTDPSPLVVPHPTLIAILKGRQNLIYQHGEHAIPKEAIVAGASKIIVPTEATAMPFLQFGYKRDDITVSGLCIEPALVKQAEDAFESRLVRINGNEPLVGAFFSSGAEPRLHVEKLVQAVLSTVAHGGKGILFTQRGGTFARHAIRTFVSRYIDFAQVDSCDFLPSDLPPVLIVQHASRREENHFTAQLFPRFDYFVSPSHERTNWALGLGLPMFIIGPPIGPFAPLNRDCLIEAGVAELIDSNSEADAFGRFLEGLRSKGRLTEMAMAGWGKLDISGFDTIAQFLINNFASDKYIK
ncbi:MAG: hypothetical protein ACE5K8_06195 [Candidatus Zixiibacteriota bacterium]